MRWWIWLLVACLPLAGLTVEAQAPVGELYFDAAGGTQGQTSASYGVRTADEVPAPGKAYLPVSSMGGTYTTTFAFAVPYDFTADVMDFHFRIGCDTLGVAAPPAAASPMRIEVRDGGSVVQEVIPSVETTCTAQQLDVQASLDMGGYTFAAGSTMNIAILTWFSNPYASGAGMYYVTGPEPAVSGVGLPTGLIPPIPTAAAQTHHLELATAAFNHTFSNATSDTYVFNFTTTATHGVLDVQVNGTGLANATLVDGNGTTWFNGTLDTSNVELRNVTAGPWQLTLAYQNFTGNLSFAYADGALLMPDVAPPQSGDNDTHEDTLDADPDSQEAPVPLIIVLAGIGLAIVGRRRR